VNRNESFWKEEKFCVSSNDEHHKLTRSFVALEYRYNITSTRSARSERARERESEREGETKNAHRIGRERYT